MLVLGFMSGTSLDGVDAAVIETDGESVHAFGPALLEPYRDEERLEIAAATARALARDKLGQPAERDKVADKVVTQVHLRALGRISPRCDGIDLIGFHGQTLLHRPGRRFSLQAGDPDAIARAANAPVVGNLRQADMAAGGEGAPLVPIYHRALAKRIGGRYPIVFLNIGGVANLSWIAEGELRAFDVGPGNGLIDQYMERNGLGSFDQDGRLAIRGTVDRHALKTLLSNPFFDRRGPKSLDRYDLVPDAVLGLPAPDAARTLTAFTAECVARSVRLLPEPPRAWFVCGGGRHNPVLMTELSARLAATVLSCDAMGLRGDFIEAEAMAFLAARHVEGLPATFPDTTGSARPVVGGRRFPARQEVA